MDDVDALLEAIDGMTDEELDQLAAEMEAEDAGYGGGGPGGSGDYGPWDDLANATTAMDAMYQRDAQRASEDRAAGAQLGRRPSTEDKLAHALRRVEAGTYTPPPKLRADLASTQERLGLHPDACGPVDETGRCGARYHQAGCHAVIEAFAATGNARAASAWRDVLLSRTPDPALVLASLSEPEPLSGLGTWDYLLQPEGGSLAEAELRARVLAEMGEAGAPPPEPIQPRRDVSAIRAALRL